MGVNDSAAPAKELVDKVSIKSFPHDIMTTFLEDKRSQGDLCETWEAALAFHSSVNVKNSVWESERDRERERERERERDRERDSERERDRERERETQRNRERKTEK